MVTYGEEWLIIQKLDQEKREKLLKLVKAFFFKFPQES